MRPVVLAVFMTVVLAAVLLLSAGRWDLPMVWAYLGVYGLCAVTTALCIDPGLIKERMRASRRHTTPFIVAARLAVWGHLIVAGLDIGRFHWSDTVPLVVRVLALVGFGLGGSLLVWAMAANRFFVAEVRVQTERGHQVVTTGPYRFVRHPGYAGLVPGMLCSGLALGSWVSVLPAAVFAGLIIGRAAVEDRFLHQNLDGYAMYAGAVRYRLVPRVW